MDEAAAQKAQETYRVNQIQMASREQLLLITYDIGIRACFAAEKALEEKDAERVNKHLQKAQAVIRELMITLNMEQGGEIAEGLMRLYDFMYYQLVDANMKKNVELVVQVRMMLEELRATWNEAIAKLKAEAQEKAPAQAPSPYSQQKPVQTGGTSFAY